MLVLEEKIEALRVSSAIGLDYLVFAQGQNSPLLRVLTFRDTDSKLK